MSSDPCLFIDEVPDYSVVDGRMRVTMGGKAIVMPIRVFLQGCSQGKLAIAKWQAVDRSVVVPIKIDH